MKRLLLFILFSFLSLSLYGDCFQPDDGINLWRLTALVGSCVDMYGESILDELEELICAIGKVTPIVQTDFAPDVIISQPGYYKVCENITVPSSVLTISSNDVVVDLGHYFFDGITIAISSGFKNITIKNGLMRNRNRFVIIGSFTQNIVIEQLVFEDNVAGAPFCIGAPAGPITGLTIRDVSFFNTAARCIMLLGSLGNIISNVVIENTHCVSTNQLLVPMVGTDATIKLSFCETVEINDIVVTDPFRGLDCITLDGCDGVNLDTVEITSSVSPAFSGVGVRLIDSNNITHENVSVFGEFSIGFNAFSALAGCSHLSYNACSATDINGFGFLWDNVFELACSNCVATGCRSGTGMDIATGSNVSFDNCSTSNNSLNGMRLRLTNNTVLTSHTAIGNGEKGIFFSGCSVATVQDCFLSANRDTGLHVFQSGDFLIGNIHASLNIQQALLIEQGGSIGVQDSTFSSNGGGGLRCSLASNVIVSGCKSQDNSAEGFYFQGVNGGTIPSAATDGTVGRSPLDIEDCTASQNSGAGFYMTNVGGVRIVNCFATYNTDRGFHCDTGSWNVDVSDCVALSNGSNGFTTWDNTIGLQTVTRFHGCHAARNRTTSGYIPIISDYTQNNTLGTPMATPICGPITSIQAFAPDPLSIVPPDFSTAG